MSGILCFPTTKLFFISQIDTLTMSELLWRCEGDLLSERPNPHLAAKRRDDVGARGCHRNRIQAVGRHRPGWRICAGGDSRTTLRAPARRRPNLRIYSCILLPLPPGEGWGEGVF